jgi:hypothetical protein
MFLKEEEDILSDRKGALHVDYLSSGMDCGVHAAVLGSGQILETHWTEEEQQKEGLCNLFAQPLRGTNYHSFD